MVGAVGAIRKNRPMKIAAIVVMFFFCGLILFTLPPEEKNIRKTGIRVLIDRPPNTLSPGQIPDIMARKILPLIEEEHYTIGDRESLERFTLNPPTSRLPPLHFEVVRDDLARALLYRSGKCDVLFDTLSLSKTGYFANAGSHLRIHPGFHLSYLGFNLRGPILSRIEVRRAIQKALPVGLWTRSKYFGFVEPFPGSTAEGDPAGANFDLDRAGYATPGPHPRFTLRYLTTPVREGAELASLVREALRKIRVEVEIIPLETSLFFSKLNRGDFDIFASRIHRETDHTPIRDFFETGRKRNYFGYSSPDLDQLLKNHPETPLGGITEFIQRDLPVIPLFTWKHGILLSDRVRFEGDVPTPEDDSFRFLRLLRLK